MGVRPPRGTSFVALLNGCSLLDVLRECRLQANAGTITTTRFDTEYCCDKVSLTSAPSIHYSGHTGPNQVAVAPGDSMLWESDSTLVESG